MPNWFNYRPLAPAVPKYMDDGTRDICSVTISDHVGEFEIGLIGSSKSVELVRVTTLNSDGDLTPAQSTMVSRLTNHMLAVLRITHASEIDVLRWGEQTISLGSHGQDGKPNLGVTIETILNAKNDIDGKNVASVFLATLDCAHLICLIADSQDARLPLQYRYLSLYKILELEFRRGSKWVGLSERLDKFEEKYKALNVSNRSLKNLLHELRDKCAHIKTGREETLGIVGVDHQDAVVIAKLMPLVREVVLTSLEGSLPGLKFVIKEMW